MNRSEGLVARHVSDGRWIRVECDGPTIAAVAHAPGPIAIGPDDDWIAPALWDIQTNGRLGVSFSDPDLTVDQVRSIVLAHDALGTARLCPTLITAPEADLRHGLQTIAAACEADPEVAHRVAGIHLEGPFLSAVDGYRAPTRSRRSATPTGPFLPRFKRPRVVASPC